MTPSLIAILVGFAILLYVLVLQTPKVLVQEEGLVIPEPKLKGDVEPGEFAAWVNRIHNIRTKDLTAEQRRNLPMDFVPELPQRTPQCAFEWSPMFDKQMDPFLQDLARSYYLNSNFMYREFLIEVRRIMDEQWGAEEGDTT